MMTVNISLISAQENVALHIIVQENDDQQIKKNIRLKFPEFSLSFAKFSNSLSFPCREFLLAIFPVFPVFPVPWVAWGRTRRHLPSLWRHLQSKRLEHGRECTTATYTGPVRCQSRELCTASTPGQRSPGDSHSGHCGPMPGVGERRRHRHPEDYKTGAGEGFA